MHQDESPTHAEQEAARAEDSRRRRRQRELGEWSLSSAERDNLETARRLLEAQRLTNLRTAWEIGRAVRNTPKGQVMGDPDFDSANSLLGLPLLSLRKFAAFHEAVSEEALEKVLVLRMRRSGLPLPHYPVATAFYLDRWKCWLLLEWACSADVSDGELAEAIDQQLGGVRPRRKGGRGKKAAGP